MSTAGGNLVRGDATWIEPRTTDRTGGTSRETASAPSPSSSVRSPGSATVESTGITSTPKTPTREASRSARGTIRSFRLHCDISSEEPRHPPVRGARILRVLTATPEHARSVRDASTATESLSQRRRP